MLLETVDKTIETTLSKKKNNTAKKQALNYESQAKLSSHPLTKKLFDIALKKESNLCVAADVTKTEDLILIAETIGSEICTLKTNVSLLRDFKLSSMKKLKKIAEQQQFLIMEDQRFSDTGHIAKEKFQKGAFSIAEWADIITAQPLAGLSQIRALKEAALKKNQALLLVAEINTLGNLTSPFYKKAAEEIAKANLDFIIGFMSQSRVSEKPQLINFVSGIHLFAERDHEEEKYKSPQAVIEDKQCEFMVIGRGITHSKDIRASAIQYRKAGWRAYKDRF